MKTLAKVALAFAVVAFATPALPCGANKTTTAEAKSAKATVASAEKVKAVEAKGEKPAPVKAAN